MVRSIELSLKLTGLNVNVTMHQSSKHNLYVDAKLDLSTFVFPVFYSLSLCRGGRRILSVWVHRHLLSRPWWNGSSAKLRIRDLVATTRHNSLLRVAVISAIRIHSLTMLH